MTKLKITTQPETDWKTYLNSKFDRKGDNQAPEAMPYNKNTIDIDKNEYMAYFRL